MQKQLLDSSTKEPLKCAFNRTFKKKYVLSKNVLSQVTWSSNTCKKQLSCHLKGYFKVYGKLQYKIDIQRGTAPINI